MLKLVICLAIASLYVVGAVASPALRGDDSKDVLTVSHQRGSVTCPSVCYNKKARGMVKARRDCKRKLRFCEVRDCKLKGVTPGLTCGKIVATPTPVPPFLPPGATATFPKSRVGEVISFKVNITVRGGSGAKKEDFYLLSDATGSMSSAIATSRARFTDVVRRRSKVSGDVAFGVGFYRDEEDIPFRNLQSITTNTTPVFAAINSLRADGGLDAPEANLFALSQVATKDFIGWRKGSRKILVYFGDNPGHEPTCPDGVPLNRTTVIRQLKAKDITVVATSFSPGLNDATTSAEGDNPRRKFACGLGGKRMRGGQATAITSGTGGALVPAADQASLIASIIGGVGDLAQTLRVDTSDCKGKVGFTFNPKQPLKISSKSTLTFSQTARILPGACGGATTFTCRVDFKLSGVSLGMQKFTVNGLKGC